MNDIVANIHQRFRMGSENHSSRKKTLHAFPGENGLHAAQNTVARAHAESYIQETGIHRPTRRRYHP